MFYERNSICLARFDQVFGDQSGKIRTAASQVLYVFGDQERARLQNQNARGIQSVGHPPAALEQFCRRVGPIHS